VELVDFNLDGLARAHGRASLAKWRQTQAELLSPRFAPLFQRNEHIREIARHGRMAWQKKNSYGLRIYAELGIQRYKRIFGGSMKARAVPRQKSEAWSAHRR